MQYVHNTPCTLGMLRLILRNIEKEHTLNNLITSGASFLPLILSWEQR